MTTRRAALAITLTLLSCVALPHASHAQDKYPSRPIKVIVPTPAGGPVDVVARLVAQYLSTTIGQSAVIDNRPGAGNTIGSREAARADPDGYTLHYSSVSGLILAPMLQKNAGYTATDFTPIAAVATSSIILVVNPSFPAQTVKELVDYAKANPGKVNFSSGGIGVLPHLIGEMFKSRAGVNIVHVPYKGGGPSIQDVVAGNIHMTFEGTSVLLPLIEAGKLRPLAVTSAQRIAALPNVPTMIEAGFPDFATSSWTGLLGPLNLPAPIVAKLNSAINDGLKSSPELRDGLAKLRAEALGGTPQDFGNLIKADVARWEPVVKGLNLQTN